MGTFKKGSVEKLNSVFEQFFIDLGYDEITCELSNEFAYYYGADEITYTLLEMPLVDLSFKTYLKNTYPNLPECSMMVFSLLHELGHHLTMNRISEKKMKECENDKERIAKRAMKTSQEQIQAQIDYCKLYDERIATKKATEILIKNYDYILGFEQTWFEAVMNFYAENGLVLN